MNLRTLHYFLIAAEEENVTRAAERLYISQQALSIHIKRLEEEYGVTLFERKPFFRLTEAGRHMVYYSRQLLGMEESMKADFSDLDLHAKGLIRLGISRLRSNAFFPYVWEKYYPAHPNISIELLDGNRQMLADLLSAGKLDLYISLDIPDTPSCNILPLYEERPLCMFRLDLLRQHYPDTWEQLLAVIQRDGVPLSRMSKMPFISTRSDNALRATIDQTLPRETQMSYILQCNGQQLICRLAMQGYGAGIISPAALYLYYSDNRNSPEEDLCVYPLEKSSGVHKCSLVYRRDWMLPRYAQDLIREIQSTVSEYKRFMADHFSL